MVQCKGRRREPTREELDARGKDIVQKGVILDLGSGRYMASSCSKPGLYYEVTVTDNCWRCTCPYHVHGNRHCKHIGAVQPLVERIHKSERDVVSICDSEVRCVSCGGDNCKHRETRRRKMGVSERYECKACGKKFTYNPGFVGRHYSVDDIIGAIQDVAMGKSSAQAAQSLAKTGRIPDQATVWRWACSFGSLLKKLTNSIAHRTGYEWSADELYFKSMGRGMWLFGVMDTETRFVMYYDVSPDKMGYDATNLFAGAVELAGKTPDAVTTDALPGFASGLRGALPGGRRAKILHRKDAGIHKRHSNNNTYERFNGTLKDRLKSVRGFHSQLPALHVLYLAYYNLFRPHSGMGGKTPTEALGIILKGPDKWLTAIRHAVLFCT